jgi:hypothetical protein
MSENPDARNLFNPKYRFVVTEVKSMTGHDWANVLGTTASAIETVGAGVTHIPPEYFIAGCGFLGIVNLPAAVAVISIYGGFLFGPNLMRRAADSLKR